VNDIPFHYANILNPQGRLNNRSPTFTTAEEATQWAEKHPSYDIVKHISHRYSWEEGEGPIWTQSIVASKRPQGHQPITRLPTTDDF
jgi:hypothetical protein